MKSHYETLGVDSNATIDEIKKKYRALSLRYHPDLAKTKSTSNAEMFKQISLAYSVLSDKKERKLYDIGEYILITIQNIPYSIANSKQSVCTPNNKITTHFHRKRFRETKA